MAKTLLEKRCLYCNEKLIASQHSIASERKKRDEKKLYCNGQCAAKHKAAALPFDPFSRFTGVPNVNPINPPTERFKTPGRA